MTIAVSARGRRQLMVDKYFKRKGLNTENMRRKLAINIPRSALININVTNITSQSSLRPAVGSVEFKVLSAEGYIIEAQTSGFIIQNKFTGLLDINTTGISPNYFEKNAPANYTVSFNPINFEQNMKIHIGVPWSITIPDKPICRGLLGTDQTDLTCTVVRGNNTLIFSDALVQMKLKPDTIKLFINNLTNPKENVVTKSFQLITKSYDGYKIDERTTDLAINFYCVFPCKTCNLTNPTQCTSCYWTTTEYKYLYKDQCRQNCPDNMYEILTSARQTCDFCKSPCATCRINATYCETCIPDYKLYVDEHTCYEIINYPFPILCTAFFFVVVVLCVDCFRKSTNFLQALLFFLSFLEVAVWCMMIFLYGIGKVEGHRSLSVVSFAVQDLLNLFFIPVHLKLMMPAASPEYKQVFEEYKCSSWTLQIIAYLFNFKMSLILISSFAARPRFSGTFSGDSWQKFNLFAILYIVLTYLPFMFDFYVYFTTYGLRQYASYVGIEAVVIMTIICLTMMLEILQQCQCVGILERDLGKRAGLSNELKKGKKKRRALRSGMGNDESDYGEYDSEHDYYFEDDADASPSEEEEVEEEEYYDEEEEEESETYESVDAKGNKVKRKREKTTKGRESIKDNKKELR